MLAPPRRIRIMPITRLGAHLRRSLCRLARDKRGNIAMIVAVAMPLLIGSAGLAVDTIQWVSLKNRLQQASDSAAIAGSLATVQGGDVDYEVDRGLQFYRPTLPPMAVSTDMSPAGHDGDPNAVAVRLTSAGKLYFSSLFLSKPIVVSTRSVATIVETRDFCAFALLSGNGPGISLKPGSSFEAECGVATNASGENSVDGDASASFSAAKLFAYGGIPAGLNKGGRTRPHALRQQDPLASVEPPQVPNTGCPNITVNGDGLKGGASLKPGCYGNVLLDGQVRLEPGEYVLNRGSLILGSTAYVTCAGCSFFFTSEDAGTQPGSIGSVRMDDNAVVKFSAPSQGPYQGILMYQDRRALSGENVITGNSRSSIDGILYFPAQDLVVSEKGSSSFDCARMIGRRLYIEGRVYIAKNCDVDSGKFALAGAEVRLVE